MERPPALAAAVLFVLLGAAPLAAAPADSVTTVILVRHAEKDGKMLGADPPLSAAGIVRSHELARVLADARVEALYVTPWQRTRQTALPLATRLGDSLTVIDAVDATVERLRTRHPGKTVLVVGHSNTVPQMIEALTGEAIAGFSEGDFDRLYVVTFGPGLRPRVVYLHYGAPSP